MFNKVDDATKTIKLLLPPSPVPSAAKATGLDRQGENSVTVHLFGATVISWKHEGKERLFLSSKAVLDGSKAIRGGIPLVFPQFGKADASHEYHRLGQHGFARNSWWRLTKVDESNTEQVEATFELTNDDLTTKEKRPFRLIYQVMLSRNGAGLTTRLGVESPIELEFQALFHTYFRVSDISQVRLRGLDPNVSFIDKTQFAGKENLEGGNGGDLSSFCREIDRIYPAMPSEGLLLMIGEEGENISIKCNHHASQVVVWNPWVEKSAGMSDMEEGGHRFMLCVEPGCVNGYQKVSPSETWWIGQELTILKVKL